MSIDNKHQIEIRVYYEDTDCSGVVYYGKYLTYLEWARTQYLEAKGFSLKSLMDEGIYFVVVNVNISYKKSARYGDIIIVNTELESVSKAAITFKQRIINKETLYVLTESTVKLACVAAETMKPVRLKEEMYKALSQMET